MSEELLSQEEIKFLMETLEKKKVEKIPKGIQPFDFDSLERISSERYPRLEQFLSNFSERLSEELKKITLSNLKVKVKEKDVKPLSKIMPNLSPPVAFIKQHVEEVGELYTLLDAKLSYAFISMMLGGEPYELEGKPFSRLELNMLKKLSENFCSTFQEVWSEFFTRRVERCELSENVYELDLDDDYYIAELSVEYETLKRSIFIAFPLYILKEIKEELSMRKPDPKEKEELLNALLSVPLILEVLLFKKRDRLNRVVNMGKGFVILTSKTPQEEVEVTVQGKLKFLGILGEKNGKRAVKISKIL